MQKKPKFSILIPTWNRYDYLEESLNSALNQSFKDYEIIVSDNDSIDNTWVLLKKYSKKNKRIRIFKQKKNNGSNANIKFLMRKARGKYCCFLFDDDKLDKNMLLRCDEIFLKYPKLAYIYTSTGWIDKKSKILRNKSTKNITILERYGLLRRDHNFGICGGVFQAKSIQFKDSTLAGDLVFALELSIKGKGAIYDDALYYYRFHPGNESQYENLFDKSVAVFDTFKKIYELSPLPIKKDFEIYVLNQKYLLFLSSIIFNGIIRFNLKKCFKRIKLLNYKTKFFKIRFKGVDIYARNSLRVVITVFRYKQNKG